MAGPGAGAPEHRTIRGSPGEAVGGRDPGQGGQSIGGTGRTGCTGASRTDVVLLEVPVGGRHGSVGV